jgi:pimeloyl-ACP methyl ester carboxylesterase
VVLGCAAVISLTWLYPGTSGVRPDPVAGVEWLDLPDGSRLALHVIRAAAATQPPIIFVHGGPGVADMAHDAAAFGALATDRDVYVYDRIGTGASTRLPDPTGYTTARALHDLEAVRARTGAPRVVLVGHSWGACTSIGSMIKVPALVIKPACDYLAWSAVVAYRHAFPQTQLVLIPDAGHVAYLEQPVVYTNLVRAFLAGQKLPLPTIDLDDHP